jgi:O-acetyl-ADP-ribose deacetylase (regulator of RNase III)
MIKIIDGDVFQGSEEVLIHGCNCQGVMGGGVAAQVRALYPYAYSEYVNLSRAEGLKLGQIQVITYPDIIIVNAMTQDRFGTCELHADYDAIRTCLKKVATHLPRKTIRMPKIGAGLAGGDWNIIYPIVEEELCNSEVTVYCL